ncbi:hypothetical protein [Occultella kanbiaonis]|uniref:hypothetical protein n=1 Tax=Occultella kanbiaonis TaxID=2675754 RepID=UPI0012B99F11|nr:hypothetical protein [Occultella kanbiaonis]
MSQPPRSLAEQARAFANELTASVYAVIGSNCAPFVARALTRPGSENFTVRQAPSTGIPLPTQGAEPVTLTADYKCAFDGIGRHLRINKSSIAVYYGGVAQGEPLFRYEYDRSISPKLPRAHFHVHGHPSNIAGLMYIGGDGTKRGRYRQDDINRGRDPVQSEFHFPLGGDRFRPTLEDVLQILVEELGVQAQGGWRQKLGEARARWRDIQLRAAVRDNPAAAAGALEDLGYAITPPEAGHPTGTPEQTTRL